MTYNEKRMVRIFGFLVFVLTLIPYLMTVAPTLSFWDCGEFIACGSSLSVPHPPGAPLYILINRIMFLLFSFISDESLRINILSPISGAFTSLFIFLCINRIIRFFFDPSKEENVFLKMLPIIGGFAGALFAAYSFTNWFNNVEAEVYGIANCVIALQFWIGLKWYDHKGTRYGNQLLLLVTYIAFLGIGIQLNTVIPIPCIFLFVILNDEEKRKHWQLWLIGFCMLSVMYSISSFLTIGPVLLVYCLLWMVLDTDSAKKVNLVLLGSVALYSLYSALPMEKNDEFEGLNFILGLIYLALSILPFMIQPEQKAREQMRWSFSFFLLLVAFIGFSVHFYIPIRSYLDPYVDENNPEVVINNVGDIFKKETWEKFIYFVERKQYGSESMITRMFHRRGQAFSQFINHQHMGFGGYLAVQFYNFKDIFSGEVRLGDNTLLRMFKLLLYLLPLLFVLWAMSYVYKRNRIAAITFGLALFGNTIGMILYMNFADGTVPEYREMVQWEKSGQAGPKPEPIQMEVRERDYFWNPGYMLFGLWVGLGFASFLHLLATRHRNKIRWMAPLFSVLILASPALPLTMNMGIKTRAHNWVPYDYAYNLLQSCERDGILFTNGDNDTFPLWTLQETYGIRRDVRVVNLSLLNTDWYIAQLIDLEPKLNIPLVIFDEMFQPHLMPKEDFLKNINVRRNMLQASKKVIISPWKLELEIPENSKAPYFRIQDYMILNIVHGNVDKRPIYFAVTVSEGNLMGLTKYLSMEGMVYRLLPEKADQRMNSEKTLHLLDYVYRYTNLGDKDCFLNDEHMRLLSNYAACFIGYVYEIRNNFSQAREKEKALEKEIVTLRAAKKPDANTIALKEKEMLAAKVQGDTIFENIKRELSRCVSILPNDWRGRLLSAQVYSGDNKFDLAEKVLKDGITLDPDEYVYYANLGFLLRDRGRLKDAVPYLEKAVYSIDSDFKNMKHRETVGAISILIESYKAANDKVKLKTLLRKWVDANPQDRGAQEELSRL